ncbi:hypothetical protein [Salinarimonas ramus]|uniref:hypothetical protein n=1 Tax=Salinarimonas ramus TaxID=690164 RepID=UPI001667705A|nr:hypothetical protein [Salinarimonas ramus]
MRAFASSLEMEAHMPETTNDEARRQAAREAARNAAGRPILTPQNRADPGAHDATAPGSAGLQGRAKLGQADAAEGER